VIVKRRGPREATPNCASPHDGLAPKMLSAIFRVYTFFLGFLYPA
jgi:hypothetical protein